MSYFGDVKIINKKVLGKKLLYLVVNNSMKKWIDYEQLTEHLPEVIEYEKRQNYSQSNKISNTSSSKERFMRQRMENNLDENSEMRNKSEIKFLEFLDQVGYDNERREKVFLFRVYFLNGKSELLTNTDIKNLDPHALMKFYQNQIKVSR